MSDPAHYYLKYPFRYKAISELILLPPEATCHRLYVENFNAKKLLNTELHWHYQTI